ncbi:MAG: hypothetical protein ACRETG_04985 [Steroidobacteraceae bacterium]
MLDPAAAGAFIEGYKQFLLTVASSDPADKGGLLETLVDARRRVTMDPALFCRALAEARKVSPGPGDPVLEAIATLRVENWIYLKDTRSYAVFMDSSGEFAFAVRGLTERVRDVIGTTGVLLETGIVRYCGQYVCDGLVSGVVHLGRNYLHNFLNTYARLRTEGRFEVECAPTSAVGCSALKS